MAAGVELLIDEGLYEEAIETSEKLVAKTRDPYQKIIRQLRTGDIYQRLGKTEASLEVYEKSLLLTGANTWIEKEILSQIEQVFRKGDNIIGLAAYFEKLAKTHGPNRTSVVLKHAETLMELTQTDEAIELFSQLITRTPGDRSLREKYIQLLRQADEVEKATEQMLQLTQQYQDDPELLISLADLQHLSGKNDAALQSLSKYSEKSEYAEFAKIKVARLQERYGNNDAANTTYSQLVQQFPENISIRETYASFLYRIGKQDQAIAIWKKLALDGDGSQTIRIARALMSRLENKIAFQLLKQRYSDFKNNEVYLGQLCKLAISLDANDQAIDWSIRRVNLVDQPIDLAWATKDAAKIVSNSHQADSIVDQLKTKKPRTPQELCLLAKLLEQKGDVLAVDSLLKDESNSLIATQKIAILKQRQHWEEAAKVTEEFLATSKSRNSILFKDLVLLYKRANQLENALHWIERWKAVSPTSLAPWFSEVDIYQLKNESPQVVETLRLASRRFEDNEEFKSMLAQSYTEISEIFPQGCDGLCKRFWSFPNAINPAAGSCSHKQRLKQEGRKNTDIKHPFGATFKGEL